MPMHLAPKFNPSPCRSFWIYLHLSPHYLYTGTDFVEGHSDLCWWLCWPLVP